MALKATIYKAELELADMDRNVYREESLTLARHPSETDERMLVRLLVYALSRPEDDSAGVLEFAKDMWEPDEPCAWEKDFTGSLVHWIEVGQPDEKRILRAAGRAERVSVWSFSSSTPIWWSGLANKLTRAQNVTVWQIPAEQSAALANLAERSMRLMVSVQDGTITVSAGEKAVEVAPVKLMG